MNNDNLKLLAVATLLGVSLFNVNRLVVKNLPKFKHGVVVSDLDPVMDPALLAVESVAQRFGFPGVITSGLDESANRLPSSFHPLGLAVDARRVDWPNFDRAELARQQTELIARELGENFDVVLESNHIHIEHDPELV